MLDPSISVVGGKKAKAIHWPYFVSIRATSPDGKNFFYHCGGSMISPQVVLTAAHCVAPYKSSGDDMLVWRDGSRSGWTLKDVVIGWDDLTTVPSGAIFEIAGAEMHAGHGKNIVADDIAVIRLKKQWNGGIVELSNGRESDLKRGISRVGIVSGFGVFQRKDAKLLKHRRSPAETIETYSLHLREGRPAIQKSCEQEGVLCAGGKGVDSCNFDSGGPLIALDVLGCPIQVGLVNSGPADCGSAPGIYTSTARHREWLAMRR